MVYLFFDMVHNSMVKFNKCRKIDCSDKCWTEYDRKAGCFEWAGTLCACRRAEDWFNMTLAQIGSAEPMDECNCATTKELACACSPQFTVHPERHICIPTELTN